MNRRKQQARRVSVRARPPTAEEQVRQAIRLLQQGRPDDAEPLLGEVLRQDPSHVDALHFLGVLAAERGRHLEGTELIRRALALDPDYVDAWNNLGNLLLAQGQLEEAQATYRRTIGMAPEHANAYANLGVVLLRAGRFAEAMAAWAEAVRLEPRHANAHYQLGKVLTYQGRFEEAIGAYREAIRADPAHAPAYQGLATVLYKLQRPEEAVALYRQWLARDPSNPVARHMVAASSGHDVPGRASDDYVRGLFDGMADSFDDHLCRLEYRGPEWVGGAVAEVMGTPERSRTVLDVGCGTGLCGPFLRPYARQLTGVDLSARMVERARARGGYDELVVGELTDFLRARKEVYDLIVSADTLVYFGDLDTVCSAAGDALCPGGWFVFTVERSPSPVEVPGFNLEPSGRYSHAEPYVRRVLAQAGMAVERLDEVVLRLEAGQPVAGLLVACRKAPSPGQR